MKIGSSIAGPAAGRVTSAVFKVDVSRGQRIGRVSSEWFSRPNDERYLSLSELYGAVRSRAERALARTVESRAIRVEASRDNAERLALIVTDREALIAPTHSPARSEYAAEQMVPKCRYRSKTASFGV